MCTVFTFDGAWIHMVAKLRWWIVVACLRFVDAGGFILGHL